MEITKSHSEYTKAGNGDITVKFKYVRIQGKEIADNTNYAKGIFSMCWNLIQQDVMDEEDAALYREIDAWIAEMLPYPEPCMKQEKVICFFKTENYEEIGKLLAPAMWLLEKYNHPFYMVCTNFPGEIVYEDKYQVAVKVDDMEAVIEHQDSWTDNVPADRIQK